MYLELTWISVLIHNNEFRGYEKIKDSIKFKGL